MKEITGDLWEVEADARVITTNGFVKKNGMAVMGRGVAQQALRRYPIISETLGRALLRFGNHLTSLGWTSKHGWLWSFPVKHNWWEKADLELIRRSAEELVAAVDKQFAAPATVVLPRPGCGNGGLRWEDVKPVIEPILDDRFVVVEL